MKTSIPIYRAKKIDSDEYVEGSLIEDEGIFYIVINPVIFSRLNNPYFTGEFQFLNEIDKSTLAIHFSDMLDSKGKKIFASLSEDGTGGDLLRHEDGLATFTVEFSMHGAKVFEYLDNKTIKNSIENLSTSNTIWYNLKVTGIQK